MSNLFLIGIYSLVAGNVIVCVAIFIFLYLFLNRQREGFQYLAGRIAYLEKILKAQKNESQKEAPKRAQLSIPLNEPIAKYENMSLPDDVKINFVED